MPHGDVNTNYYTSQATWRSDPTFRARPPGAALETTGYVPVSNRPRGSNTKPRGLLRRHARHVDYIA